MRAEVDDEDNEWDGKERRKTRHLDDTERALLRAADTFWTDEERVRRVVALVIMCFQRELESGAGRMTLVSVKGTLTKLFWVAVCLAVIAMIGGPKALVLFFKTVFAAP